MSKSFFCISDEIFGNRVKFLLTLYSRVNFFNMDTQDIDDIPICYIICYPSHPVYPCQFSIVIQYHLVFIKIKHHFPQ